MFLNLDNVCKANFPLIFYAAFYWWHSILITRRDYWEGKLWKLYYSFLLLLLLGFFGGGSFAFYSKVHPLQRSGDQCFRWSLLIVLIILIIVFRKKTRIIFWMTITRAKQIRLFSQFSNVFASFLLQFLKQ